MQSLTLHRAVTSAGANFNVLATAKTLAPGGYKQSTSPGLSRAKSRSLFGKVPIPRPSNSMPLNLALQSHCIPLHETGQAPIEATSPEHSN
jgi:hypothetical protein